MSWKTCLPLLAALALSGGCSLHSLDAQPVIARNHILGRRYVLDADISASRAIPVLIESVWWDGVEVKLSRGDRLQISHVESSLWGLGDEYGPIQAVVLNGSNKGQRVTFGTVEFNSRDAEFRADDSPIGLGDAAKALHPLPDHPPAWLDIADGSPQVRPVSSAVLRKALNDPEWTIRFYALSELVKRNGSDPATVAACGTALRDEVSDVRWLAIDALKTHGLESGPILDALMQRLADPMVLDREGSRLAEAVAARGDAGMRRVLVLLDSENYDLVDRAAAVLEKCGPGARPYTAKLVRFISNHPDWGSDYRLNDIHYSLHAIDLDAAVSVNIGFLANENPDARNWAAYELRDIYVDAQRAGDTRTMAYVVSALAPLLNGPDGDARQWAVWVISPVQDATRP